MISLTNLGKTFGANVLFESVNARFDPGKVYGIVGANGAGKSTLLRMISGEEIVDHGEIGLSGKTTLGTMIQEHFAFEDMRIRDVVLQGRKQLADAIAEKRVLLQQEDPDPHRIAELEDLIAHGDGYAAEAKISEMLDGLGIPASQHDQPMSTLSGGYKNRVLLAQCLFSHPDALLLDEPTNHLDILSLKWLEKFLIQFPGIVVVVSHDRSFLDHVCDAVLDLDFSTAKMYKGNYTAFLKGKEEEALLREMEAEKAEKKIEALNQFVTRFKAKATKARQAQSKAKQIDRMERDIQAPVYSSRKYPVFRFTCCRPPGKVVLETEALNKSFADHVVLRDVNFTLYRGDKVAVIGPNGIGKSTLLKILTGQLQADSGTYSWGYETHPLYFAQDHRADIKDDTTPYQWLYQFEPGESIGTIRSILGQVLFSGDDVHRSTAGLSGGEASRLVLAKLILLKGNVLVLDEPTNHLDMESIESLVEALQQCDHTIILVSHNRYVVENVATKILELKPQAADFFDGSYREYLDKVGVDHLAYQTQKPMAKEPTKENTYAAQKQRRKTALQQEKAIRAKINGLKKKAQDLENQIQVLEQEVQGIHDVFSDPNYFARATPEEVRLKDAEKRKYERQLERLYAEWEGVQLELEPHA